MSEEEMIIARLQLWRASIRQTKILLDLHLKVNAIQYSEEVIDENDSFHHSVHEYLLSQGLDPSKGSVRHTELEFLNNNPRPFPTMLECMHLEGACAELVIVCFCQLFGSGNGSQLVKANPRMFNSYWNKILSRFPKDHQDKIQDLKGELNKVRAMQDKAKAQKKGLWSDSKAIPPWEFRRKK